MARREETILSESRTVQNINF